MPSRNRGKPKPRITDLSRIPPTSEERAAVRQALGRSESPIATAILGATIVEFELEEELRSRFRRQDDDTWKDLISDNGPLGTLNQKIIAAYAFGILNDVTRDGIDKVRNIRNQFAHSKRLIDFEHDLIVRELKRVKLPKSKHAALYKRLSTVREMKERPRTSYIILCLILGLDLIAKRKKRASAAQRARLNRRRKALADALKHPAGLRGLGLLGLPGGYPNADPNETTHGIVGLLGPDPGNALPGK